MAWRTLLAGLVLVILGSVLASRIQTAGGIDVSQVDIPAGEGEMLSALLYVPENASEETPAPAILAVHGYINSRETQTPFAIEFARRGYVVLALDQSGHGFSTNAAFAGGFGGPAGLAYLRALPMVDADRIGLEGHSMGGWTVLAAAATMPEAYRSVALIGSSTGAPFAAPGTPQFPRNTAVIFSQFDEFAELMWGVGKARNITDSEKLQALFGTDGAVEPRKVYGDIEAGTARWLTQPGTTHPGDHWSAEAVGDAVSWMDRTLGQPVALAPGNQIWRWKEIGTLVALIGGMVLLTGAGLTALTLAGVEREALALSPVTPRARLIGAGLAALVPALTFFPLTGYGEMLVASPVWPQAVTNQILAWALGNGLIALAILAWRRPPLERQWLRPALAALAGVAALYAALYIVHAALLVDMRIWVVALKPPAAHHWLIAAAYVIPLTAFFYFSQKALHISLALEQPTLGRLAAGFITASAGGLLVLVIVIYAVLFATGALPGWADPLFSIVLIQFVPVLAMTGFLAALSVHRTGGVVWGAAASGVLVTLYVVAGQATHV